VSPDGQYIANKLNTTAAAIMDNQLQVIKYFKLPNTTKNATISGLAFTGNNTLLVSTKVNLYVVDPTSCPQTYINQNSFCVCSNN